MPPPNGPCVSPHPGELASDVVLMSRQGSSLGSAPEWIEATGAGLAIATGGIADSESRAVTLERWRRAGADILDTRRDGGDRTRDRDGRRARTRRRAHRAIPLCLAALAMTLSGAPSGMILPHVGNRAGRRPIHVADHPLLDRARRYRSRKTLDLAAQARAAPGAHQEGLRARRAQPGQSQGHRSAREELAARPGSGRGAGQPPSRSRHHDGTRRRRGPPRGARAGALREFRGHHRQHLAFVRPARYRDRHHPRVQCGHARRHG